MSLLLENSADFQQWIQFHIADGRQPIVYDSHMTRHAWSAERRSGSVAVTIQVRLLCWAAALEGVAFICVCSVAEFSSFRNKKTSSERRNLKRASPSRSIREAKGCN